MDTNSGSMISFQSSEGLLHLQPKLPRDWKGRRLPGSEVFSYQGRVGTMVLQMMEQSDFSVYHLHLQPYKPFSLFSKLKGGLQSILALEGKFPLTVLGEEHFLSEGQFLFFHGQEKGDIGFSFPAATNIQIWSALYQPPFYKSFLRLFPKLGSRAASYLLAPPIPAHTATIAAIRDQFYHKYAPHLQTPFLQLKTEEQFFGLMAQVHDPDATRYATAWDRKMANAAHELMMRDIKLHYTNEEIAALLHVNRGALNKAFRRVYGLGMKEYLIWVRLERSKELLLEGHPVKKVAEMVGYKYAATFAYEFKKFFHCSPVDFQAGKIK